MFFFVKIKVIESYPQGMWGLLEEGLLLLIYRVTWLGRIIKLMLSECFKNFSWDGHLYTM